MTYSYFEGIYTLNNGGGCSTVNAYQWEQEEHFQFLYGLKQLGYIYVPTTKAEVRQ